MKNKEITPAQRRMQDAVAYLKDYMGTYDKQYGYLDYSDDTLINDVLYGLGVALDPRNKFADGFAAFKKVLLDRLRKEMAEEKRRGK